MSDVIAQIVNPQVVAQLASEQVVVEASGGDTAVATVVDPLTVQANDPQILVGSTGVPGPPGPPGDPGSGSTIAVRDEGNVLTGTVFQRINFIGAGVTAVANGVQVDVTIPGATGGALSDGDKGDIIVSGGGGTWEIQTNGVTFAKIQQVASGVFLGRATAATGNIETLTPSQAKTLLALTKADVGLSNVDDTSDANKPVSTATATALSGKVSTTLLGAASGVATLDGSSKLPVAQLPDLAIKKTFVVADQASQLALTAQEGDQAVRTDLNKTFSKIHTTTGTMADWQEHLTPTTSVPDGDKGDITISGGVWSIDAGVVTLAKMANIATATFIGRSTAGTGVPEALTATQATALLNTFTTALKGLAPASGGGTTNFLRADGTWAPPPAPSGAITASGYTMATARMLGRTTALTGAIEEMTAAQVKSFLAIAAADVSGLSALATSTDAANLTGTVAAARLPAFTGGDVTSSAGSVNLAIGANAVTLAKMAQVATATFLGRVTAATGNVEAMTATQATSLLNTFTTALKGLVPASGGGTANFLRADGTWAAPASPSGALTASGYTMSTARMLGRTTAATGAIEEMTAAQVKSFLAIVAADVGGLSALATSTDAANLTGTVAAARMPAFTGGDVTSSAGSVNLSIGAGTVTLAKMANVATGTVFYRKTAASGAPEVQTLATLKTDLGLTGTNSGDQFTNMTSSRVLGRVTAGLGAAEELTTAQVKTLLAYLASEITFTQGGTGATNRTSQDKMRDTVSPFDFGAAGNGSTNDATALANCFTYAFANGKGVDGGDAVFAVSGDLAITSITRPWIKSLRLKQLTPADTRKTLNFSSCERIRIDRLEVDLGTSPTLGAMNTAGGLWIDGGSNHRVSQVDVIGQGEGNGVVFWNCSHSTFEHIRVRDLVYSNASASNDVLNGIWLSNCTNCILQNPIVSNLTGDANVSFPTRFTRGIVLSGCVRCSIVDPHVSDVDQGIDYTGSSGNRGCSTIGGHAYQCCTVGHKHANSSNNCRVVGFTSERCGSHGFLVQGPAEAGLTYKCQDNDFVGCNAIDIGYNGFSAGSKFGYSVEAGGFDTSFPKGIRFIGCRAVDSQAVKTMITGFRNSIAYDGTAKKPNETIDCLSEGHTSFAVEGIHRVCCRVTLNAAQNILTGTPTALLWNGSETEDTTGMHDPVTNSDRITISIPGLYRVRAKATYASNNAGFRRLQVLKNAATNIAVNAFAPVLGEITTCMWDQLVDLVAGDYVWVQTEQNSAVTLAVGNTNSWFEVELIRRA